MSMDMMCKILRVTCSEGNFTNLAIFLIVVMCARVTQNEVRDFNLIQFL